VDLNPARPTKSFIYKGRFKGVIGQGEELLEYTGWYQQSGQGIVHQQSD